MNRHIEWYVNHPEKQQQYRDIQYKLYNKQHQRIQDKHIVQLKQKVLNEEWKESTDVISNIAFGAFALTGICFGVMTGGIMLVASSSLMFATVLGREYVRQTKSETFRNTLQVMEIASCCFSIGTNQLGSLLNVLLESTQKVNNTYVEIQSTVTKNNLDAIDHDRNTLKKDEQKHLQQNRLNEKQSKSIFDLILNEQKEKSELKQSIAREINYGR